MTVIQMFNLNLVSENQYVGLRLLGEDEIRVEFKYERKLNIEELTKGLGHHTVAYVTTKITKPYNHEPKSYLVLNLYGKSNGGKKNV